MKPKLTFFLGKGGVGKSTLSALTALKSAIAGNDTLVVSMDPAHNLGDIYQKQLGNKEVKITNHLTAIEIDLQLWIKHYLTDVENNVKESYRYLTAINLDQYLGILKHSPGIEEYALLMAIEDIYKKNVTKKRLILIDMPPTALAVRFFSLANLSLVWLEKLLELRNEIIKKRELITRVKMIKTEIETDKILRNLNSQQIKYKDIHNKFSDSEQTTINLVLNPDLLSVAESKEIITTLLDLELEVNNIFVNKANNQEIPDDIYKSYPDKNYLHLPNSENELIGLENLKEYIRKHGDRL